MADYKGKHRQKKTIKFAPDAVVYLNGEKSVQVSTDLAESFSKDVLSIQTQASTHTLPGTCSISIKHAVHSRRYYKKDGSLIFQPKQEIHVFFKGRFIVKDDKGRAIPKYYQAFHGVINSVDDSYSGGQHSISIQCSDMLQWWKDMKINISPAIRNNRGLTPRMGFNHLFAKKNPFEIIIALSQLVNFGAYHPERLRTSEGFIAPSNANLSKFKAVDLNKSILDYWTERFKEIVGSLKLFGFSGEPISFSTQGDIKTTQFVEKKGEKVVYSNRDNVPATKNTIKNVAKDPEKTDHYTQTPLEDSLIKNFHEFASIGTSQLFTSHIMSLLDVAILTKDFIGYEFFMDVTGEIVFKPPFYNLDVRGSRANVITDDEIYSWGFSESDEVCTVMQVIGDITGEFINDIELGKAEGFFTDYRMVEKFGYIYKTITQTGLLTPEMCKLYAISEMDRINSKRFTGSVTIVGTPELRLGYPVYIEPKDTFYYISSISHSFDFGGSFKTTIQLEGARKRFYDTDNATILKKQVFTLDPKTETTTNSVEDVNKEIDAIKIEEKTAENKGATAQQVQLKTRREKLERIVSKLEEKKAISINKRGGYVQRTFSDIDNIDIDKNIIISDEDGYEVIGILKYGRGFTLDTTGRLTQKSSATQGSRDSVQIADIKPRQEDSAAPATAASLDGNTAFDKNDAPNATKGKTIGDIGKSLKGRK